MRVTWDTSCSAPGLPPCITFLSCIRLHLFCSKFWQLSGLAVHCQEAQPGLAKNFPSRPLGSSLGLFRPPDASPVLGLQRKPPELRIRDVLKPKLGLGAWRAGPWSKKMRYRAWHCGPQETRPLLAPRGFAKFAPGPTRRRRRTPVWPPSRARPPRLETDSDETAPSGDGGRPSETESGTRLAPVSFFWSDLFTARCRGTRARLRTSVRSGSLNYSTSSILSTAKAGFTAKAGPILHCKNKAALSSHPAASCPPAAPGPLQHG